jgi:flavin-dependent dehydrogenase
MKKYDIVIAGASTTGAWFAKKMAAAGHSVLVIEKQKPENISREYDIFHMGELDMKKFDLHIPKEGDDDYGFVFTSGRSYSPFGNYPKSGEETVIGMHKHEFIMNMNREAIDAGAEIIYGAAFSDFLKDEKGNIIGAKYITDEGEQQVEAQLVADCTGIPSAARRKLPDNAYVENFALKPEDIFHVVLYYAKYVDEKINPGDHHGFFMQYKSWSAPSGDDHGAILGVGASYSYGYAEEIFERDWKKNVPWPKYTVDKVEKGMTPYHRTLYSFVEDGFIAMGDTAFLTKPTCGEGCTSSLYQAEIAVEVISKLLKEGKPLTKENMWSINKRYFQVQGKDFDSLRPLLIAIVGYSYEEAEFLFKKDVLFSQKILGGMGQELDLSPADIVKMVAGFATGVATGKVKASNIKKTIEGLMQSMEVTKLYDEYPDSPAGYFAWKAKADELWKKIGKAADTCDPEILRKLGL